MAEQQWLVEVHTQDGEVFLLGKKSNAAGITGLVDAYRTNGGIWIKRPEEDTVLFTWYPTASILKYHCRPAEEYDEVLNP